MLLNSELRLVVDVLPWTVSDRAVTFSSTDPAVASVDAYGKITAIAPGEADIIVSSVVDPEASATCHITAEKLQVTFTGITRDETNVTRFFTWDMPNGTTTRAQIITVLYRLAGSPETELNEQFTDVNAEAWYAEAVAWAYANEIATGITDTLFAPEQPVTREQVVTFLYRYAQFAGVDTSNDGDLSTFTDAAAVSEYALEAMTWAVDAGIITGMDEATLAPSGTCIRAQIAAILMRFMEMGR